MRESFLRFIAVLIHLGRLFGIYIGNIYEILDKFKLSGKINILLSKIFSNGGYIMSFVPKKMFFVKEKDFTDPSSLRLKRPFETLELKDTIWSKFLQFFPPIVLKSIQN